ncbi:hypothetical protein GGI20_003788 [Coemansia sp. BCRC 34301]|nr:hypothetical protein GGI20_003788 [Coemansia sp. BCRC 34301]
MSTEFDRLMRLAEQNTLELQRASLDRKRHIGDRSTTEGASEREIHEKRRKLELEKRIKQREDDEKQRQAQARADVERRRRERLMAEEAEEAQRKQAQQQKRQSARGPPGKGSSANGRVGGSERVASSARDSSANRRVLPREDPALPKRPDAPQLSYNELMRIASGQAEPPTKRPANLSQQRTQVGAARTAQGRQQPGQQRSLKAEPPKLRVEAPAPRRQQPAGSTGVRQLVKPLPPKSRDLPVLSPASKVVSATGCVAEPRERQRASQASKRTSGAESVPKQKEPRVRKAPEREIDRFGVRAAGSARRDVDGRAAAKSVLPQRARGEAMPRPNGHCEQRADRCPGPRSPVNNRSSRISPGDRSIPAGANRQHARRPSPPAARGRDSTRQPGHRRRSSYNDESEYDSLDDFIVDDEEEGGSKYRAGTIREIMGVKYRNVNDDDDDDDMEVSTRQLMMEERRSARIGRQEDEEEERRLEKEERARARRRRERM